MANGRSRHNDPRGFLGPIPKTVWMLLEVAHDYGIAVSSNLAREEAQCLALAASVGWLSTIRLDGEVALRHWNITTEGLHALEHKDMYT